LRKSETRRVLCNDSVKLALRCVMAETAPRPRPRAPQSGARSEPKANGVLTVAAAEITSGGRGLDPRERVAWREQGFFFRAAVFSGAELAALREAAEAVARLAEAAAQDSAERYAIDGNRYVEAQIGALRATVQFEHAEGSRTLRVIEPFHTLHPAFERLVDDPRIVEPVRELVGTERVALFTDKLNLKRPREGSRFDWHQDSPYWAHFCTHLDQLPNVMLALDDADRGNGCFRLIPGSHRHGMLPGRAGEGVLGPLFTRPDQFDESAAVAAELPAGSLVFFSPHSVHGSLPNRSERARRALVLTYQPAGLRLFKADRVRNAG
jgi:ectoine hydroxylase-related dioxygenase (phytanoyl-CoA dioxygenase family)